MAPRPLNYEQIWHPGKEINPESQFAGKHPHKEWMGIINELAGRDLLVNIEGVDDLNAEVSFAEFEHNLAGMTTMFEDLRDIDKAKSYIEADLYREQAA